MNSLVKYLFILSILIFNSTNSAHAIGNGSISLTPAITAQTGEIIQTPVMINTDGEPTAGVDVILNFDKNILQLTDITVYPENSGNAFQQFLTAQFNFTPQAASEVNLINQANNTGQVAFSAITGVFTPFNGTLGPSNPLAVIKFKILSNSPTTVSFDYTPNSTRDTNMVSTDGLRDLIKSVTNLNVNQTPPITYPETSPNPSPKPGDINGNTIVEIFDHNTLLGDFGKTGNLPANLDKQGSVDIFDYTTLLTNFGQ